ncbi:Hsp90 protein-domain-containing protein [Radiomyces spectabilis]|uniref:Hsp90 protein-domain-containing protein n=1 Tax=Radiomyces spectabilis TaxID=64574 RepID=UPI00222030C7|nr:Hsp90 protein-domain-containing protein [Radiomyces spectabilis]KAI8379590.1 Hsp90 protein-domain-containing protein [Radiomyces spectabilis]
MLRQVARSSLPHITAAARRQARRQAQQTRQLLISSGVKRCTVPATQQFLWKQYAMYSTETTIENKETDPAEVVVGQEEVHEFKTETKKLLHIVANSLYSEKEIFVRELVSNAADALEKLRHSQMTDTDLASEKPLEIRISLDHEKKQFIIQDYGIGMTLEELNENLGTIARSGSKNFLEKLEKDGSSGSRENIIGQFGVGFYSTFMVGEKIKVYTRSAKPGSKGYCWTTDGQGSYTVAEAENVAVGTKIVIELRDDCKTFSSPLTVESIIKKYSNFVGFPIYLNDKTVNTVEPLWTKDKNSITTDQHKEFYRFIANAWDEPQYTMHFKTDAPISIASILYVPERHMESLGERQEPGVSLYSRKVLIQPKSRGLLPEWLRFVKGVVDSEDIPLNVSRELLQDNILSRLRMVMTSRVLKWLDNEAKRDAKKYNEFFLDFGQFIKEGVCTDSMHKRDIAKLLRFETSATKEGEMVSLQEYADRKKDDQKRIYYLLTPKRRYAEESPYTEMFKKKGVELLYLYDTVDEFVVGHLREFQGYDLVAADSAEAAADPLLQHDSASNAGDSQVLSEADAKDLASWIQDTLGGDAVKQVDVSRRLDKFPAIVLEHESPAMRKMMQMMQGSAKLGELPPSPARLEINPDHAVMKGLFHIRKQDPALAKMVAEQVYDNALCAAGVLDDPRSMITRLNTLLEISLNKTIEQDKKVSSS